MATGPPPGARQAVHIYRTGLDYLLKALTDTWLLPLPTATDPFFLRWWADDTTLSALATNGADQVRRMMDAEGTIKRALSAEACKRLSALESTVGLRMASMQQHGALAPRARAVERGAAERGVERAAVGAAVDAQNWRTLATVLYPEGAAGFNRAKRQQWREEQQVLKLQARHRRKLLNRRCQKREEASMQAAALVVQYFYRHKLRVGRRGALLANMALEAQQQVRREEARQAAQRRKERAAAEAQHTAYSVRMREQEKRKRLLAEALRNTAAAKVLKAFILGFLARRERARLARKRATFLREFTQDITGHLLTLVVKFQVRVRVTVRVGVRVRVRVRVRVTHEP